jgi:hypothetical protein
VPELFTGGLYWITANLINASMRGLHTLLLHTDRYRVVGFKRSALLLDFGESLALTDQLNLYMTKFDTCKMVPEENRLDQSECADERANSNIPNITIVALDHSLSILRLPTKAVQLLILVAFIPPRWR